MENERIIILKHHPRNLYFTNPYYQKQFSPGENPDDYVIVDTTSRNKDKNFIKGISPFFIGPCKASDGLVFNCFENMWQFDKVYSGKTVFEKIITKKNRQDIEFIASDPDGNPTDEWFKIRKFGASADFAYRHPYIGTPLYHYYRNEEGKEERLGYVESRKKIYIPEYAKLVYNNPSFNRLKEIVNSGKKLALVDFDGYNYYNKDYMKGLFEKDKKKNPSLTLTAENYKAINTLKDVTECSRLIAGHAFVLKMMLQGDIEVIDGKVTDHAGILC